MPELTATLEELSLSVLEPARTGVDAVHIPTWRRHLELAGAALEQRIYTDAERRFCAGRIDRLATRLAAKEAVLKVLGTGIRGIALHDVEIVSEAAGRPRVVLHGPAAERAGEICVRRVDVSLCHEDDYALAVAAGLTEAGHGR